MGYGTDRRRLGWLEAGTAVTAAAVLAAAALTASRGPDPVALALFAGLLVWAENVAVRLPTSTRVSPSFMVAMATVTAYRGGGALLGVALTGACGGLAIDHLRRRRYRIVVFNCAQYLLAAAAAEGVYATVDRGGFGGAGAAAVMAAAAAFWAVNTGLIVPAIVLDTGTGAADVWRDLAPTIPNYLAFGLLGTLLGYLYRQVGAVAVLVLASPIVIARSVFLAFLRLRQAYARLELLYGFTGAVGPAADHDEDEMVATMLPELRRLLRTDLAQLHLDAGKPLALLSASTGGASTGGASTGGGDRPGLGPASAAAAAIIAEVTRRGRAFRVAAGQDDAFARALADGGLFDSLVAPVRVQGRVLGALLVANRQANEPPFTREDVQLFETVANHASVSLERGRLIDRLRHESTHDNLTGLANRTVLSAALEAALTRSELRGAGGAVLLMDLDRFKEVNDTLGHDVGDALLREIGHRLAGLPVPGATIARLGGDEFGVLLPEVHGPADSARAARLLLDALRRPFPVDDIDLELGASIGIAQFPRDGQDAATLLRRADMAMYVAKADRLGWSLYDRSADLSSHRRLAIASDLRRGIEAGELRVHYQPMADLRTGRLASMEALVRWQHPRFGPLAPDEFIPLAEQTGLVRPLTHYVLARALSAVRRWRDLGFDLDVAVNLSVRVLLDPSLPGRVEAALRHHGTPARWLTLEITETAMMSDPAGGDVLRRLAALGVTLSIDDFGTGYSSLAYLRDMPVGEVKIDRSFVANCAENRADAVLVRSIVDLARHLGLRVVAEGVEDQATWNQLEAAQCDVAQGYFLTEPLPEESVAAWCER
ncbi:MAG TPA: EAL domain-containing protein, partial [Acidimicrobiales bacterium]